jgi:AcrR family transcriptional regulator
MSRADNRSTSLDVDVISALGSGQRLRRSARHEQILAAATRAFAQSGFAATSLDEVATEARISKVLLYRHFVSKADLYLAVLDRACARLVAAVGGGDYMSQSVDALIGAAALDPDGFRLLFQHAAREPEFRQQIDAFREQMATVAYQQLAEQIPNPSWARWAAQLTPMVVVEAITAWLDAGQPDREEAADRIRQIIVGVVQAAQPR